MTPRILLVLAALWLLSATGSLDDACAAPALGDGPVLLQADSLAYDQNTGVVSAIGTVEISQEGRRLTAAALTYDPGNDLVSAAGDVMLREANGDLAVADYMELNGALKQGVIHHLRLFMDETAQITANTATKRDNDETTMEKVLYTSCRICTDHPDRAPIWRLRASRVIHDGKAQRIVYHHARLELFGYPVLYMPWLSHADSFKRRESGLLTPRYGRSDRLGFFYVQPAFLALGPDQDLTLRPILTAKEGGVAAGRYRKRFDNGFLNLSGSVTEADFFEQRHGTPWRKEDSLRGHVDLEGRFDLTDTIRAGATLNRASDRSYLDEFAFFGTPGNTLTSTVYGEYFQGRTYGAINFYEFQDLRPDQGQNPPPQILQIVDYQTFSTPDPYGGRFDLSANARVLIQDSVSQSERLSVRSGYVLPYTTSAGYVTTVALGFRSDLYYVEPHQEMDSLGRAVASGAAYRLYSQASVDWRYPLFRPTDLGDQIIEPIVAFYAAPSGGNTPNILNDDSAISEQDDTTLFSRDRLPGLDRVEGGQRAAYALRVGQSFSGDRYLEGLIGQSYRLTKDHDMEAEMGIENGRSDYFGLLSLTFPSYMSADYRFRLDDETLRLLKSEAGFTITPGPVSLEGTYTMLDNVGNSTDETINQLTTSVTVALTDAWSVGLSSIRNLTDTTNGNAGSLSNGAFIAYDDECIALKGNYTRSYTSRTGGPVNNIYSFRIAFKTLAGTRL